MNKIIVPIAGMHCRSCEMLIEEKLSEIPEVRKSIVKHKKGTAEIFYATEKPNRREIEEAVRSAGYTIGVAGKRPWFTRNESDYKDFAVAFLFVVGLYFIAKDLGLGDLLSSGNVAKPTNFGVALLVGLTAGFSTCLALVGGLVLGISARHAEKHPESTPMQKFRPHIFFNVGRIASYAVLGGALGSLGSLLQFSGTTLGLLTLFVGVVMLGLGLKLTGLFPRLETAGLMLPKSLSRFLGVGNHEKEYSHKNAFVLGALTFFLPCGFTQAMQLYAVSTGSFLSGSIIMGFFALGTAPGLLGIGGLASAVKGVFAQRFFKFAGILVVLMAFFNLNNGWNLTGWEFGSVLGGAAETKNVQSIDPNVTIENGKQVVRMKQANGYMPNKFTIQAGVPVRWVINSTSPYNCASSLMVSKLKIRKNLVAGENVIEFMPKEAGTIPFSCSMGMYRGVFTVVKGGS